MKKLISKIYKKIYYYIYSLKYRRDVVIFESVPNLSDNTKPVYDEMIKRDLNKKYTFVWWSYEDKEQKLPTKNCEVFDFGKNDLKHLVKRTVIYNKTKCVICCNRFINPNNRDALNIYLRHGNPLKKVTNYYSLPEYVDFCLCSSKNMINISMKQFAVEDKNKMIALGYPRNDAFLYRKNIDLRKIFNFNYKKIIVWYPTFKKAKNNSSLAEGISLPILHSYNNAQRINETLINSNILLILKPHFAQDVNYMKNPYLSNIKFIDDSFFVANNIKSYELLNMSDALLTDYSSIYYDFTLANKPIGLVWEDIDDYRKKPGFIVDLNFYMKGGVKIYNCDELISFVEDISNEIDILKKEREEIRDFVNEYNDGHNTKRVVDFILNKVKL